MLDQSAARPTEPVATGSKPVITRIQIFPVKSLDPIEVERSRILASGALEFDRAWAIFDSTGGYVNGKRHAAVHRLRSRIDPFSLELALRSGGTQDPREAKFHIENERRPLEKWLEKYFGFPVTLREDTDLGFPDDLESPGPTIISVGTLTEIGRWFGLSIDDVRKRFRANIEIDGVPPFWEDRLFGPPGTRVRFRIGDVVFDGINPCQRCVVPPRDAETGISDDTFVRRFTDLRERTLPYWSTRERFNHFYRVAINTRLASTEHGDVVRIGDEVEILDPAPARSTFSAQRTPQQDYWAGELIVTEVRAETPSVKTFRMQNCDGKSLPFSFFAGQFLAVSVNSGAESLQRCYTISSSPSEREYCEITVKRDGRASSLLHDIYVAGSRLQVSGPMGRFTFNGDDAIAVAMIAGGVGLTPLMSKLRFLRDTGWPGRIDLIYSARSGQDVIFEKELRELERTAENIDVHITVTGDDPQWRGARGRLNAGKLGALVPNITDSVVHICGPTDMAAATQKMLHELGVEDSRIEMESFGGPHSSRTASGVEHEVNFARSRRSVAVENSQTILEAALAAGISLDHGCRAGVCGRCKTLILEGEVTIDCDFVLTPEQKARRIILTCQARAAGPLTVDC